MLCIPPHTRNMTQDIDSDTFAWPGMQMKQALIKIHHSTVSNPEEGAIIALEMT